MGDGVTVNHVADEGDVDGLAALEVRSVCRVPGMSLHQTRQYPTRGEIAMGKMRVGIIPVSRRMQFVAVHCQLGDRLRLKRVRGALQRREGGAGDFQAVDVVRVVAVPVVSVHD